ncbi:MAG: 3-hydroxyanthranilate 3,4-dioxygenase [Saprospiraceae bacterium]|jgi:3-hydroxyanthranilate 3,4-dioxygenase|nr:3-hydroxyanthranilate 3,4-dioxygenase [Saprospiraceae bacterium]MBL0259598.1 3-hydroxyanthranilate 3,4-dioxygenase [Saprospiraceae bacterium]MBX7162577.1 3-hydroxyanthranilate 3,4-dioxygenase [Saprospiraceae bacterium]
MAIRRPFNIHKWIEEHRSELKPPVGNRNLFQEADDFIVMIVAGPNARKDYHYNETEEWFYQIEGDITVRIQEDGKPVDVPIKEGEIFLLPSRTPHSPIRPANTIGLVIEAKRRPQDTDGLMWFCEKCNEPLHQYFFPLKDIEKDFIPRFKEYYNSEEFRTCKSCGHVMETDPRFVEAK